LRQLGIGNNPQSAIRSNIANRASEYPVSDDLDADDEVVSINDSLNLGNPSSSRIAEIGTIQSANTRRIVEQNLSSNRRRNEESKHNATQNLDELLKCLICFGKIEDAVICPSCSKLCCRDCMRKWITEQRQQCPHCRSSL